MAGATNIDPISASVWASLLATAGSDAHDVTWIGSVFVEYAEADSEHGISPRGVFFPAQPP